MPAHRTATGKALLAELTPAQLDGLFAAGGDGLTAAERTGLGAELATGREQGYATNHREADDDEIVSVATVVRDRRDLPVAALNASAPAGRMARARQLQVVRGLRAAAGELQVLLHHAAG